MTDHERYVETGFLYSIANNGQFKRLATYLGSNEPLPVRQKAIDLLLHSVESLLEQDTKSLVEELYTAALRETNETVRAQIVELLLNVDDTAVDTIVDLIESADYPTPTDSPHPLLYVEWVESSHVELRLVAVAGLGRVGSERIVPKLVTGINDSEKRVKIRALQECGHIGDPRCVDPAIDCLNTTDSDVRAAAAACLVRIGTDDAVAAVMPLAITGEQQVQRAIITELGSVGSLSVFGVLLREISSSESTLKEPAIRAAIELICHADAANSHTVRVTVATHFDQYADQTLITKLQSVADASEPQIRRNAIWVLLQIIDPAEHTESLDKLIPAIADTDETTAKMTVSKLAKSRDPVVIDRLEQFLKTTEVEPTVLQRADYIREQIEKKTPDDRLKDTVEYTRVTDPADYTKKHADR